jgi:CheY-like chemotaxis protein/nitrogen-specific signal transduction histidine kinase
MFRAGGFMAKARRRVSTRKARKRRRPPTQKSPAIEVALAGLAHDIRTPLSGILALSQLLQASDLPKRERSWAEAIRDAADHMARLTTLVVDAAKADATRLVLRDEPFSPQELAHSVAKSLTVRAQAKALDVEIDIAKGLRGRVSGDEVRLRSALENLVDNAVKFTERGGIGFGVSSAALGSGRVRLTFTVTDSGMGITAADLKRLFRPFAQASEAVARRYGGAGLGLVLVKRIAKAMGGDLVVTSKPGRGSTFRLTVVMNSAVSVARRPVIGSKLLVGLRVLSVEDNPYGRIVHSAVLRELGHTVSFVGSGEAAVETVARNEHDVVLMDVALPGIDGIEATRRIRALAPPAGRIPIIGLSGHTEPHDAAAAKAAGMNAYLRKPASPAELNEALRAVTRLKRA